MCEGIAAELVGINLGDERLNSLSALLGYHFGDFPEVAVRWVWGRSGLSGSGADNAQGRLGVCRGLTLFGRALRRCTSQLFAVAVALPRVSSCARSV